MLGGVQAGLIVGQAALVKKVKKNPIFRTVRVDKVVFAVLEKLLTIYLNGTHQTDIKLWQVLSSPVSQLRRHADAVLKELGRPPGISAESTPAFVGGGALPEQAVESIGLVFSADYDAEKLLKSFRSLKPPVVGRIDNDRFILDLKAVDASDIPFLTKAIRKLAR